MKYTNPIIPGFNPDPSVCRVGEDYYLVTSSFEFFPGVPVYHSRDLVHWRQIGYCLTRASQLLLQGAAPSRGLYAPTLRHHAGRFYMVTTNTTQGGHFYVSTQDPADEWSEPIWVPQAGIDPSLLFDDDGQAYFTSQGPGGIWQSVIDIRTGKYLVEPKFLWSGTGDRYPEAPHLYKINGKYYLMIAEGGTGDGHMETIARSDNPWGPFEPCPRNPILTHRFLWPREKNDISCTGHADLIQAHDGSWWAVFLAVRHRIGPLLGRESFLAPVTWDDAGWPVFNGNRTIELEMEADVLPPHPWEEAPACDHFDDAKLRIGWNFVRNPHAGDWSLAERPGWLRLRGSSVTLGDLDSPALVIRRQQHATCRVSALLDFQPASDNEEAGLAFFVHNTLHAVVGVTRDVEHGKRVVFVRRRLGDLSVVVAKAELERAAPVILEIRIGLQDCTFSFGFSGEPRRVLATGETGFIAAHPKFTGPFLGMYATGNGKPSTVPADFDWFEYSA